MSCNTRKKKMWQIHWPLTNSVDPTPGTPAPRLFSISWGFFSEKLVDCWVGVLFCGHPQRASVNVCTNIQPIQNFHLKKNFGCSTVRSTLWEPKVRFTSKTGLKALSVCMEIKLIATTLFLFGFSFFWCFIDRRKVHCRYLPYLLKGAPLFSYKRMPILQ